MVPEAAPSEKPSFGQHRGGRLDARVEPVQVEVLVRGVVGVAERIPKVGRPRTPVNTCRGRLPEYGDEQRVGPGRRPCRRGSAR